MVELQNQFSENFTYYSDINYSNIVREQKHPLYRSSQSEKSDRHLIRKINNSYLGKKKLLKQLTENKLQALQEREEKLEVENPQYKKKFKHQLLAEIKEECERRDREAQAEREKMVEDNEQFWKENASKIASWKREAEEVREAVEVKVEKEKMDSEADFKVEVKQEQKKEVSKLKSAPKVSKMKSAKVKVSESEKVSKKSSQKFKEVKKEVDLPEMAESSEVLSSSSGYNGDGWENYREIKGVSDIYSAFGYDKEEWE